MLAQAAGGRGTGRAAGPQAMDCLTYRTARVAVGVFHDLESLQRAVGELEVAGVAPSDVTLMTDRPTLERRFGCRVDGDPGPRGAGRRYRVAWPDPYGAGPVARWSRFVEGGLAAPLLVSDGMAAAELWRALAGLSLHGSLIDAIKQGAVLVCVAVGDSRQEKRVCTALLRHTDSSVQVHDLIA